MKITIERNPVIWLILISLTMLTSIFIHSKFAVIAVLCLAFLKLNLLAFQFVELRHAHRIWKISFLIFTSLLFIIIWLVL